MKIFTKFMLVLFVTSLLLLSAIFALLQWSFDRGMLNYVNQKELDSLQLLSNNLSLYYQEHGDWLRLTKPTQREHRIKPPLEKRNPAGHRKPKRDKHQRDNSDWPLILFLSQSGIAFPNQVSDFLQQSKGSEHFRRKPPKRRGEFDHPPARREAGSRLPPPREHRDREMHPSLLDQHKNVLIGRYNSDFIVKEIILHGQVIGYLALPAKKHLSQAFDIAFLEKSQQIFLVSFLLLLLLITLVAIPFSGHFLRPIKLLDRAMSRLNRGDFDIKLDVKGKDELASLSLSFNDLALTLKQNEQSRNRWLADISHELRTPLAIIKGEIEAIQDGIRPMDINSLHSLSEETEHLQKLIDDLAELSNAEIGAIRYQKQKVNIVELIEHNVSRHFSNAEEKQLKLQFNSVHTSLYMWADPTRINQLIDNIINNSIKYTDAPGEIAISLSKQAGQLVLNIDDSTPTVEDSQLNKLFDHLYRVESSRNRQTGGSGIGLSLCKKIIEAHQGTVSAQQSTLGGVCISCRLPLIK